MIQKVIRQFWVVYVSVIFIIAGCDNINFFSSPYVAEVNGSKIFLDEYQTRLAQKKMTLPKEIRNNNNYIIRLEEEVLESMITEKILYLRTQELKLTVSPAELEEKISEIKNEYGEEFSSMLTQQKLQYVQWKEDLKREMLFEKLITVDVNAHVRVSDDEAEDYFNEHRALYKEEARVRALQIVVRDLAKARKVLQRLNAGVDFASVAEEESIGPEARRGGDLGFITRQVMPEPLDETIFNLPVNKISPIVRSPYGFHIFQVQEIKPAKIKNFAESREEIIASLRAKKEEAAFASWLDGLKIKAVVKKSGHGIKR